MLFPASLIVPRGLGASFYLLLICGLAGIALRLRPMGKSFGQLLREYWPLHLSMAGLLLATLVNQLASGCFSDSALELPFLFACFPLLFWALLLVPERALRWMPWILAASAIMCSAALYIKTAGGTARPLGILKFPLIPFGNISMLLGVVVLLSIGWKSGSNKFGAILKIMGGIAGFYGSYLSQARGGWVAIPVFVVIALYVFRAIHIRHKLSFVLVVMTMLGGVYIASDTVQTRIAAGKSDILQFVDGSNKDTSLGQRIQILQGGWQLFKENAIFGIGQKQYPAAVKQLAERQVLTTIAASQPHSHNELLFHSVVLGVFGLVAIVSLYLAPGCYFFKEIRHADGERRIVAGMGMALVLGFFVFGLSDVMFFWRVDIMFYVILLAVLFACLEKRKAGNTFWLASTMTHISAAPNHIKSVPLSHWNRE